MITTKNGRLYRIGEIVEQVDAPAQQVNYVIQKRRIQPRERCGLYRLFDGFQVEMIRTGLAELRPYQKS
ncbi:MAG: hypothetical protein ACOYIG_13670 [Acetivibrionales bacterium]|jgi:hypothetical protein